MEERNTEGNSVSRTKRHSKGDMSMGCGHQVDHIRADSEQPNSQDQEKEAEEPVGVCGALTDCYVT